MKKTIAVLLAVCLVAAVGFVPAAAEKKGGPDMTFDRVISKEVLCNYLSRAVTISVEENCLDVETTPYIEKFILNTGAKYICRASTEWSPNIGELQKYPKQKVFIDHVHQTDPDVIFEGCLFECVGPEINSIPIPAYVFEDFGLPVTTRNFSYSDTLFPDGTGLDRWGTDRSVPDITRQETMLFFYYRACEYIKAGFEGLHMGQVEAIGQSDRQNGWQNWTGLCAMIRAYAAKHARRHMILLNAHTHGIMGSDGNLLFDFHMYPSRPKSDATQKDRFISKTNAQNATYQVGYGSSIYRDSMGGTTYSGWSCPHLPYLVELDNFGYQYENLNQPTQNDFVWGLDEISWFMNQPTWYRQQFLQYAVDTMKTIDDPGLAHFAMPGQRVAYRYVGNVGLKTTKYMAYDPANNPSGNGDEAFIKEIWAGDPLPPKKAACGDVNGDARIDAADALTVLKYAVHKTELDEDAKARADVNGDSAINAADALDILKYAVHKIDKFPKEDK